MEEPLHEIETVFTLGEIMEFFRWMLTRREVFSKEAIESIITGLFVSPIIIGFATWIAYVNGRIPTIFFVILLILLVFLILLATLTGFIIWFMKTEWKPKKILQGTKTVFRFFRDEMIRDSNSHSEKISYDEFCEIVETETSFYFMTSANVKVFVVKEHCSQELQDFIRQLIDKVGLEVNKK